MGPESDHEVICMTGGTGETSYATNSLLQKTVIQNVRALLKEAIESVCLTIKPKYCLNMADLGCSSGPNALDIVESVIDVAVSTFRSSGLRIPEFGAFMNDLPQNDFKTIFNLFSSFYRKIKDERGAEISCFISGTPGSFYGRLFPTNSIHFMHSSYSLHWRSQVPDGLVGEDGKECLNKGCIYARKGSPPKVLQAYRDQFAKDFTAFLKCRSQEIVYGGRMLLTMVATDDEEISVGMESLCEALNKVASKGMIDKEKLDAFNLPYHRPTVQQAKQVIEDEGSFTIDELNTFTMPWDAESHTTKNKEDSHKKTRDARTSAKFMASSMRAAMESFLVANFGEGVIDDIIDAVEEVAMDYFSTDDKAGPLNLVFSLIKIV